MAIQKIRQVLADLAAKRVVKALNRSDRAFERGDGAAYRKHRHQAAKYSRSRWLKLHKDVR